MNLFGDAKTQPYVWFRSWNFRPLIDWLSHVNHNKGFFFSIWEWVIFVISFLQWTLHNNSSPDLEYYTSKIGGKNLIFATQPQPIFFSNGFFRISGLYFVEFISLFEAPIWVVFNHGFYMIVILCQRRKFKKAKNRQRLSCAIQISYFIDLTENTLRVCQ